MNNFSLTGDRLLKLTIVILHHNFGKPRNFIVLASNIENVIENVIASFDNYLTMHVIDKHQVPHHATFKKGALVTPDNN